MKMSCILMASSALACLIAPAEAFYSYHDTNLVHSIKPNPTAKSKPAVLTKLAAIYFISGNNGPKFGSGGTDISNNTKNCPEGTTWVNGSCQKNCDRTLYPFNEKPDEKKGVPQYTFCQGEMTFGYKSCNDGWVLENGDCIENTCAGYSDTTSNVANCETTSSCQKGDSVFYKCTACSEGWDLNDGICGLHDCDTTTYPYTSHPGNEAGTVITCKSGTTTLYGYSNCNEGWDKVNGYCNIHFCDTDAYPYSSSPSSTVGTVTTCKTGSTTKYGYSSCNTGYDLTGGKCEASCDLSQYPYTSSPDSEAGTIISCTSGTTTKYAYSSCNEGWTFSGGYCDENLCNGYYSSSSSIPHCDTARQCRIDGADMWECQECEQWYALMNGLDREQGCVAADRVVISVDGRGIGVAVPSKLLISFWAGFSGTWGEAKTRCASSVRGGKNWRLPTKEEGLEIWNARIPTKATFIYNHEYLVDDFWTSTEESDEYAYALHYFYNGVVRKNKNSSLSALCVTDYPSVIYSQNSAIGVLVASDLFAAMTDEEGEDLSGDEAQALCAAKTTGGKSWRLPTSSELTKMVPTYNTVSELFNLNGGEEMNNCYIASDVWMSTRHWVINPSTGKTNFYDMCSPSKVRCVFDY